MVLGHAKGNDFDFTVVRHLWLIDAVGPSSWSNTGKQGVTNGLQCRTVPGGERAYRRIELQRDWGWGFGTHGHRPF